MFSASRRSPTRSRPTSTAWSMAPGYPRRSSRRWPSAASVSSQRWSISRISRRSPIRRRAFPRMRTTSGAFTPRPPGGWSKPMKRVSPSTPARMPAGGSRMAGSSRRESRCMRPGCGGGGRWAPHPGGLGSGSGEPDSPRAPPPPSWCTPRTRARTSKSSTNPSASSCAAGSSADPSGVLAAGGAAGRPGLAQWATAEHSACAIPLPRRPRTAEARSTFPTGHDRPHHDRPGPTRHSATAVLPLRGCARLLIRLERCTAVAVKIKLKRMGQIRNPQYRIVVGDSRTKRDGRAIEEIGIYQPKEEPSLIKVDSERAQYWLSVGAQPTAPVEALLKVTGDWQKFKGEEGADGTLRTAAAKVDKRSVFEAAVKQASDEPKAEATTARAKKRTKAEAKTAAPVAEATAPVAEDSTDPGDAETAATSTDEGWAGARGGARAPRQGDRRSP